jgi:hypothetical protein
MEGSNNIMKFEGVLFTLHKPSKVAPSGAMGHKVLLSEQAIQCGLEQLPGTPLFSSICLTTHDRSDGAIIGRITKAFIVGDMFCISGTIDSYRSRLRLSASEEPFGLSYDLESVQVIDSRALIYTVGDAIFVGATVLYQRVAAHREDCLFWVV